MKKNRKNSWLIVSLGLLALFAYSDLHQFLARSRAESALKAFESLDKQSVELGNCQFELRVARSLAEQAQGLGDLAFLSADQGMSFPLAEAKIPIFWMKKMRFSLDILWLSQNKVIAIEPNVPVDGGRRRYSPPQPIDLVIEIAANRAKECQIKPDSPLLYPS
ncbi:MAG: hypothetical protein CEO22_89 [Candidatus Berkelbacteria bacterium Gr01-1014_85]|uniref:DUF192 domain-containing protein n=1 Tax=Candidatus Berkelbacteria bacterium Gr01-1014_85 TaxID=2017150 RepID=A0A554JDI1_9BACT|nr:MAG: hypothetical protein CEO22_89 [Candidatus Berkelbacteria bacterium Gr01-1014_85]